MADDNKASDPRRDDDAWIERVVHLAGNLGFNQMRLRWRLIRWQEHRRRTARQREQAIAHITYAHKTCHECGAVQDKNEPVCTRCGVKLGTRGFQVLQRIGLAMPVPRSMSTLLALAMLVAYARVWVAAGGGLSGPPASLLIDFGGRWPPLMSEEPWRLVTSMFLHANLWHLGFNILAIATVGPRIEELHGRATMLGLFIVTGVLANLATLQIGPLAVGVGASGGVMGLIGAAAAYGHRAGTGSGRALRDAMLKWSAYIFLFGFALGADNWAHLFGALAGAAFGFVVKPELWMRRSRIAARATAGVLGLVATFGAVIIIFTRTPSPRDEAPEHRDITTEGAAIVDRYVEICTRFNANDPEGAIAAAKGMMASDDTEPSAELAEQFVVTMCDAMQRLRDDCKAADARLDPDRPAADRERCKRYMPALDRLPVQRSQRRPAAVDDAGRSGP